MPLSPDDVRNAVTAYYAAVNTRDIDTIAPMFAADAVMRDPVGLPPAVDDAGRRERYARIAAGFESFEMTPHEVIAGGDEGVARWTARGRLRTGKDIEFTGMSTFVFDTDRRITMMSAYFDLAALTAQITG
jgi:ketosteroid isomerase-like protein